MVGASWDPHPPTHPPARTNVQFGGPAQQRRGGAAATMGLVTPLLYLCSGVILNLISQAITDTKFSAPEAHIIP